MHTFFFNSPTDAQVSCFKNNIKMHKLDFRGSVLQSTIQKEKFNKMRQCIKILLFHIYM